MIRIRHVLTFAAVGSLITVAGLGTLDARDIKVVRTAPAAATAVQVAAATPVKAVEVAPAPVSASVSVPACARKVKVIYAGYGEANRATCTTSAANTTTMAATTTVATR